MVDIATVFDELFELVDVYNSDCTLYGKRGVPTLADKFQIKGFCKGVTVASNLRVYIEYNSQDEITRIAIRDNDTTEYIEKRY